MQQGSASGSRISLFKFTGVCAAGEGNALLAYLKEMVGVRVGVCKREGLPWRVSRVRLFSASNGSNLRAGTDCGNITTTCTAVQTRFTRNRHIRQGPNWETEHTRLLMASRSLAAPLSPRQCQQDQQRPNSRLAPCIPVPCHQKVSHPPGPEWENTNGSWPISAGCRTKVKGVGAQRRHAAARDWSSLFASGSRDRAGVPLSASGTALVVRLGREAGDLSGPGLWSQRAKSGRLGNIRGNKLKGERPWDSCARHHSLSERKPTLAGFPSSGSGAFLAIPDVLGPVRWVGASPERKCALYAGDLASCPRLHSPHCNVRRHQTPRQPSRMRAADFGHQTSQRQQGPHAADCKLPRSSRRPCSRSPAVPISGLTQTRTLSDVQACLSDSPQTSKHNHTSSLLTLSCLVCQLGKFWAPRYRQSCPLMPCRPRMRMPSGPCAAGSPSRHHTFPRPTTRASVSSAGASTTSSPRFCGGTRSSLSASWGLTPPMVRLAPPFLPETFPHSHRFPSSPHRAACHLVLGSWGPASYSPPAPKIRIEKIERNQCFRSTHVNT